jgi:starch-binding outer membrane protein, SusD/RagB family
MNKIHSYKSLIVLSMTILVGTGCKKSFLEKPPTDAIVDANFFKTDEQVMASTALLYSKVWFDYNDKASYNLGDFRGGTAYSAYNDRGNVLFNTTENTPENGAAWRAFYNVVGQSNAAIYNINKYAGSDVSPVVKKTAIAEARYMRALAYRYLVMNWGEVPVIENNIALLSDNNSIHKNTIKSIWRFMTREMRAVAEDLPLVSSPAGRLTKWSAEGMLARFYLTRAGVEASGTTRNQSFLDSAKYYAHRVITNSGRSLLPVYANLFKYPYDNNAESLFELQWVFLPGNPGYGVGNSTPSYLNYSPDISVEGWGGDKGATWWILSQYEGIAASGDTMLQGRTLDQRLKATYMLPGANYPEITQTTNGVTQKLIFPYVNQDVNFASIKKYVVGKAVDLGIPVEAQRYPNNTYMQRLAEMYLIYAEATLGNGASTADALALEYFNKIRSRAGLGPLADGLGVPRPITLDDILKERFIEFAMEGMSWYDMVSIHYYNPAKAYSILNSQDRGYFKVIPDVFPNPTQWTFKKTPWANTDRKINANSGNFLLPIPAQEKSQAPNLSNAAVEYP